MSTHSRTAIDHEDWEAHIQDDLLAFNKHGYQHSSADLTNRGLVIRDKTRNQSVFLPAVGALYILMDMREVESWKANGLLVGAPALSSALDTTVTTEKLLHAPFVRQHPEYALANSVRLTPQQSKELFDFLLANEQRLRELAEKDTATAEQQVKELFAKIADYGRQKRLCHSG